MDNLWPIISFCTSFLALMRWRTSYEKYINRSPHDNQNFTKCTLLLFNMITRPYVDKHPVVLNIYDLGSANNYLQNLGIGVYHTGTHVFESEFNYGGHPSEETGIFEIQPKFDESLGEDFTFNRQEVRQLVQSLGRKRFKGNEYHLFRNNCNHFTNAFIQVLCGVEIPKWINRLARIGANIPFLESMLPIEVMTPNVTAVPDNRLVPTHDHTSQPNPTLNASITYGRQTHKTRNYIV
ncbi:unnamed protein product [Medioppia subpectinata]|uniref:PPPDE domain-containing protein n=1 Tax=Medioppia subpectinata TaxID=1979941 RepID=A0A7R9KLA0_9ACAR|nr:unnamed protein product [Medioppia subpectinata]CAG2105718.1 unnamed protein product [Medioppia subpectinata]